MEEKKPLELHFAPGCFEDFDGSQEELDELVGAIKEMFANLTPEELEARSVPVDLSDLDFDDEDITPRRLQ